METGSGPLEFVLTKVSKMYWYVMQWCKQEGHLYYYIFYAMEYSGVLDVTNGIHLFTLHLIFIPRINKALADFTEAFNNHNVRTESNWTPNQMWTSLRHLIITMFALKVTGHQIKCGQME